MNPVKCFVISQLLSYSTHSNNRVPNFTISEESIFSVILRASKEELSIKDEKDPHPRRHQESMYQKSKGRTRST